jgi:hypothetical protein
VAERLLAVLLDGSPVLFILGVLGLLALDVRLRGGPGAPGLRTTLGRADRTFDFTNPASQAPQTTP